MADIKDVITILAEQLHREHRAAEKAMNRAQTIFRKGVLIRNRNKLLHDHGWNSCGKRQYFLKRAKFLIKQAHCHNPQTLGEAEAALSSSVLIRRIMVGVED